MAFRSNGPVTLALPAFRGITRQLILVALAAYFGELVFGLFARGVAVIVADLLMLHPDAALTRMPWQLVTYPFFGAGLLGLLFALLSIWFFGSALEEERGPRWLVEYLVSATVGGAILACLLQRLAAGRVPGMSEGARGNSLWPLVLSLLLAYAHFHADQELSFNFILRLRAKYLAAIYVLFYLALALLGGDRFGAMLALTNGLAGFAYLRLAPRRGLRAAASESWSGAQEAMVRSRRRRAAKKFKVYMREQGRDINIDSDGRYIEPDDTTRGDNNKRWMN